MEESNGPILHVLVVGFHHKKGCQVEYSFPALVPGSPNECPQGWKYLPTLALPDGSHNFDEDTAFFHLPSLTDPKKTIYGISCFRQIPVEKLKNRTDDITRGTVQKSVCVLSSLPLYGHIEVKMSLITHAYFEEGDFSKVSLLEDTYHHLNACLTQNNSPLQNFVGLSAREFILQWRHKAVLLYKLMLLERKLIFFKSPVQPLCTTILTLLSLHPGMIEQGLEQSACIKLSRPMSPMPDFDYDEEDNISSDPISVNPINKPIVNNPILNGSQSISSSNNNIANIETKHDIIIHEDETQHNTNTFTQTKHDTVTIENETKHITQTYEDEVKLGTKIHELETIEGNKTQFTEVGTTDTLKTDTQNVRSNSKTVENTSENIIEIKNNTKAPKTNKTTSTEVDTTVLVNKTQSVTTADFKTIDTQNNQSNSKTAENSKQILVETKHNTTSELNTNKTQFDTTVEINKTLKTSELDLKTNENDLKTIEIQSDPSNTTTAECDEKLDPEKESLEIGEREEKTSLPRDSSLDTITENNTMTSLTHLTIENCDIPLPLFSQGYLCLPYLSLPYIDLLTDVNVRGYIVGATNVLFKQKRNLADVLIEIDGARIESQDPELRKQLHLTTEDLRFADFVVKHVQEEKHDVFLDGVGWEGGDEWIRAQFKVYLLTLLRTSLLQEGSREIEHFNSTFMSAWKDTHNYKMWISGEHPGILEANPGHPFAGQLSVADMKLRFAHTMQNTESGRKINQAMVSTGRAVATTGRAVGGAISHAKGALTNWWSNLLVSPDNRPAICDEEDVLNIMDKTSIHSCQEENEINQKNMQNIPENCDENIIMNGFPENEGDLLEKIPS